MSRVIAWLIIGRWAVIATAMEQDYFFKHRKIAAMKAFYLAMVQNNFCGSLHSDFIRRDMKRILGIGGWDENTQAPEL